MANRFGDDDEIPPKYRRHRVPPDLNLRRTMSEQQRIENIEHDINLNTHLLYEVLSQYEKYVKYDDYIKAKTEEERAKRQFWENIREKLVSAGIISTVGILFTVIWFAIRQYIEGN